MIRAFALFPPLDTPVNRKEHDSVANYHDEGRTKLKEKTNKLKKKLFLKHLLI